MNTRLNCHHSWQNNTEMWQSKWMQWTRQMTNMYHAFVMWRRYALYTHWMMNCGAFSQTMVEIILIWLNCKISYLVNPELNTFKPRNPDDTTDNDGKQPPDRMTKVTKVTKQCLKYELASTFFVVYFPIRNA
eukprot:840625_1